MGNIIVQFTYSNANIKEYDGIVKDLSAGGMGNIPDRLYHFCAKTKDGWHVTDVWSSQESFNKFGDIVMPLLEKHGGTPVEPLIHPVYNIIIPK